MGLHHKGTAEETQPVCGSTKTTLTVAAVAALAACGGGSDADGSMGLGGSSGSSGSNSSGSNSGSSGSSGSGSGSSGSSGSSGNSGSSGSGSSSGVIATPPTAVEASRFLGQAAFGGNDTSIAEVVSKGYSAWITDQIGMPRSQTHKEWLIAQGKHATASNADGSMVWLNTIWRKAFSSPDVLRQRMVLALSELLVVSMDGLLTIPKPIFAITHYADLLEQHSFGNYRQLLEAITLSSAMGTYLSMKGNKKADAAANRVPDENFAREIMQLFSIGLYQLNDDGTYKTSAGQAVETYSNEDIKGVAAALTGWDQSTATDLSGLYPNTTDGNNAYRHTVPMVLNASNHESAAKTFLGVTIPTNTSGTESLRIVLDTLFNHANTPAFVCKTLIQRFVTSNPSPAYVARISAVFKNNGSGVRGDLGAVVRAILLDAEARTYSSGTTTQGKLREPMIRLMQWFRTFNGFDATVTSASVSPWNLPPTHTDNLLWQSPFLSPSVFNFFRPGYVPPNTAIATQSLVAPEFQIATEPTVAAYINYMVDIINPSNGRNVRANYSAELLNWASSNATTQTLLDKLNLWLCANQLSASTISTIKTGVDGMPANTTERIAFRLYAAILMVMSCPEYLVQK